MNPSDTPCLRKSVPPNSTFVFFFGIHNWKLLTLFPQPDKDTRKYGFSRVRLRTGVIDKKQNPCVLVVLPLLSYCPTESTAACASTIYIYSYGITKASANKTSCCCCCFLNVWTQYSKSIKAANPNSLCAKISLHIYSKWLNKKPPPHVLYPF